MEPTTPISGPCGPKMAEYKALDFQKVVDRGPFLVGPPFTIPDADDIGMKINEIIWI